MPDQLLLICVGNTRTRFAMVNGGELEPSRVETNTDPVALGRAVGAHRTDSDDPAPPTTPVLIASVNKPVSESLERTLRALGRHVSRLGPGPDELPIPIQHSLDDASTVGADRLLDALGAFGRAKAACVVIDAGTAITIDFVDGDGCFCGGAIAPGVRMMLDALHEKTAALPQVSIGPEVLPSEDPKVPPFGRSTAPAMVLGVLSAARGLAHLLIDKYAQFYEAYPRVIATGGDAALLFENDELVEHIVPDLALVGMLEAYNRLQQLDSDDPPQQDAANAEL